MTQRHDSHAIELFVEKQVIGKSLKIGPPPAIRIEVKALGVRLNAAAHLLEICPEIVSERIADRVVVANRVGRVASN
ncbi:MAG: hypothetical protein WCJ14_10380 [Verrucomicrobiota bacterium]